MQKIPPWLDIIKKSPQLSRTKLIEKDSHIYLWLMKNDTEWINAHLPPVLKPSKQKDFLNWQKIDREISVKVEKICQEIQQSVPLKRVCITEIIRRVENKKWIEKREIKLPKTTRMINKKLESFEDFMLRKLRFVEAQYIQEKRMPTRPQLKIRAVLNNSTSNNSVKIQNEIDKTLKRLSESLLLINNEI